MLTAICTIGNTASQPPATVEDWMAIGAALVLTFCLMVFSSFRP